MRFQLHAVMNNHAARVGQTVEDELIVEHELRAQIRGRSARQHGRQRGHPFRARTSDCGVAGLDAPFDRRPSSRIEGGRARTSAGEFSAQPPCGYHPALAWICRAVSVGFGGARRLMPWSMLVYALAGFRCAVWLGCRTARSCLSLARDVTGTAWSRGYDLTVSLL